MPFSGVGSRSLLPDLAAERKRCRARLASAVQTLCQHGRHLRPDPQGRHGRQSGRRGRARYRHPRAAASPPSATCRAPSAGETIDCRGPAYPAGRDRHPGAFPRARARPTRKTWRPARAAPCMGGVTAVFEMPNTNPLTTSARRPSPTRSSAAHHRMHCDFAFFVGGTRENIDDICRAGAAAGLRRHQGVHGLVDRLAAGRGR